MVQTCPTIDLTNFDLQDADFLVDTYHLTWQEVLLLTGRYYQGQRATLLLTTAGNTVVVRQPIIQLLRHFFCENLISEAESRVYYQMIKHPRATRAAVSGRYQLVPTCGISSEDVVWVMAHRHQSADYLNKRDNSLRLEFPVGQPLPLIVTVQSCASSYLANLAAADEITSLQLDFDDYHRYRHGLKDAHLQHDDYEHRRRLYQRRIQFQRLLCRYFHAKVMKTAFEQRQLSLEEVEEIDKLGFRPFAPF